MSIIFPPPIRADGVLFPPPPQPFFPRTPSQAIFTGDPDSKGFHSYGPPFYFITHIISSTHPLKSSTQLMTLFSLPLQGSLNVSAMSPSRRPTAFIPNSNPWSSFNCPFFPPTNVFFPALEKRCHKQKPQNIPASNNPFFFVFFSKDLQGNWKFTLPIPTGDSTIHLISLGH